MEPYHATIATTQRVPLCADTEHLRALVRVLARRTVGRLLLFSIVDEHGHLVLEAEPKQLGLLLAGLRRSLQPLSCGSLDRFWSRPVEGRRHLERLVVYLLGQVGHHELDAHPALWEGSCFSDLVGARALEGFDGERFEHWLPRWHRGKLLRAVGLDALPPADPSALAALSLPRIAEMAKVVCCADPRPKAPSNVRARRLAACCAREAGYRSAEIASAWGVSTRSVRRALAVGVSREGLRCLHTRLAVEQAVQRGQSR
jgi:hypothetical protein